MKSLPSRLAAINVCLLNLVFLQPEIEIIRVKEFFKCVLMAEVAADGGCSICLEDASSDNCDRTVVRLRCSHLFHLDCIGSAFNATGAMQCPNCRQHENGTWRRFQHTNIEDSFEPWTSDEEEEDIRRFHPRPRYDFHLHLHHERNRGIESPVFPNNLKIAGPFMHTGSSSSNGPIHRQYLFWLDPDGANGTSAPSVPQPRMQQSVNQGDISSSPALPPVFAPMASSGSSTIPFPQYNPICPHLSHWPQPSLNGNSLPSPPHHELASLTPAQFPRCPFCAGGSSSSSAEPNIEHLFLGQASDQAASDCWPHHQNWNNSIAADYNLHNMASMNINGAADNEPSHDLPLHEYLLNEQQVMNQNGNVEGNIGGDGHADEDETEMDHHGYESLMLE